VPMMVLSPIPPHSDSPDSACFRSQIALINLGRSRARKRIVGTPVLGRDTSASPPIGGGPQDLTSPLFQQQVALCPNSPRPIFSGQVAGFLPLVTGADHCQFCTELEIIIMIPGMA
jgi:hypothetical protein